MKVATPVIFQCFPPSSTLPSVPEPMIANYITGRVALFLIAPCMPVMKKSLQLPLVNKVLFSPSLKHPIFFLINTIT